MKMLDWNSLSAAQRVDTLKRPAQRDATRVTATAQDIIERVRRDGDAALKTLTEQLDGVRLEALQVTEQEFAEAEGELNAEQTAAIERAIATVHRFHAAQMPAPLRVETAPGVQCPPLPSCSACPHP
jgi:histidinol dehydrogenase